MLHVFLGFETKGSRFRARDLCLSYAGVNCEMDLQETWQAMEKLVDDGLVRSIGESAPGQ